MNRTALRMIVVALALTLGAGGCAAAKKKFTRKKGPTDVRPVVYTEKEYVKPYTNEYYYTNNYNMWKVWHEELVKTSNVNAKHLSRSASEAISRLKEMQNYLEEPKKAELGEQIRQLEGTLVDIERGADVRTGQTRFVLDKTLRVIKSGFYTDDVKPWIKKDDIVL